jgi:hypothetical protein
MIASAGLLVEVIHGMIYLTHQSVKNFFLKEGTSSLAISSFLRDDKPEIDLARTCIRYLNFEDFESAKLLNRVAPGEFSPWVMILEYPLFYCASRNWHIHIHIVEEASLFTSEMIGILSPENIRVRLCFSVASKRIQSMCDYSKS